jgi:hypothetical protein
MDITCSQPASAGTSLVSDATLTSRMLCVQTLAKLAKFKGFLSGAAKASPAEPASKKKVALGRDEEEDEPDWINHALAFAPDPKSKVRIPSLFG